ncbi:tyrosine-protein phosphatase [Neisseria sp. Ec49-e6-T10]|uniref:tyrosine-protein phosphatase n=1 Tax=Neisseria sp. Ec49-e6-T10 TaxID=3140744 RepID=UPI003EB7EBE7
MNNQDTHIPLNSIHNLRDLYGIQTQDHAQIKKGMLFRSANPSLASETDVDYLKSLNLSHIVDFRSALEKSPEKESSFNQLFPRVSQAIELGDFSSNEMLNRFKTIDKEGAEQFIRSLYSEFPTQYKQKFQAFLKLAEQDGGNILFHCTAGKDRTGFASLLLLSALGVDQDTIMANFLESNLYTGPIFEQNTEHAAQLGISPDIYQLFQSVKEDYLYASIKLIKQEFGGLETYLTKTMGIDLDKIRNHYLI